MSTDNKTNDCNNVEVADVRKGQAYEVFSITTKSGYIPPTYPSESGSADLTTDQTDNKKE